MINNVTRQQIHKLIDEADDSQLDAVLDILTPTTERYTQQELDSFYERVALLEQNPEALHSVQDSHTLIRKKFARHGL